MSEVPGISSAGEPDSQEGVTPSLLLLADGDDVLSAACDLQPGPHRSSSGTSIVVTEPVHLGHKVAARAISAGERIVRCGVPIGSATTDIPAGAWVHTQNLASDYLETFARRGGAP
jgi:hypothetical protein